MGRCFTSMVGDSIINCDSFRSELSKPGLHAPSISFERCVAHYKCSVLIIIVIIIFMVRDRLCRHSSLGTRRGCHCNINGDLRRQFDYLASGRN